MLIRYLYHIASSYLLFFWDAYCVLSAKINTAFSNCYIDLCAEWTEQADAPCLLLKGLNEGLRKVAHSQYFQQKPKYFTFSSQVPELTSHMKKYLKLLLVYIGKSSFNFAVWFLSFHFWKLVNGTERFTQLPVVPASSKREPTRQSCSVFPVTLLLFPYCLPLRTHCSWKLWQNLVCIKEMWLWIERKTNAIKIFCFYCILKENIAFSSENNPSLFFTMQIITSHRKAKYFKPRAGENCILQPLWTSGLPDFQSRLEATTPYTLNSEKSVIVVSVGLSLQDGEFVIL